MRRNITTALRVTTAAVGIAIASATAATPALALTPAVQPAGSTWTAVQDGSLLVDNGRDLSQVTAGSTRTLVRGSTFQRKYGSFVRNGQKIAYSDVGRTGFG